MGDLLSTLPFSSPLFFSPLGAHYTDVETIGKLINAVVTQPLLREWDAAKALIQAGIGQRQRTHAYRRARDAYQSFLLRLHDFRVLDAACGSGNFLYLALKALRDLEKRAQVDPATWGLSNRKCCSRPGRITSSAWKSTNTPPNWPASPSGSAISSGAAATATRTPPTPFCKPWTASPTGTPC